MLTVSVENHNVSLNFSTLSFSEMESVDQSVHVLLRK